MRQITHAHRHRPACRRGLSPRSRQPRRPRHPGRRARRPQIHNLDQAKALIKEFAATLKGELEAAMKSGGPTKAIGVCKDRAPAIAADLSARSGWEVGRVSLKARKHAARYPGRLGETGPDALRRSARRPANRSTPWPLRRWCEPTAASSSAS